jgi:putative endopeptidase
VLALLAGCPKKEAAEPAKAVDPLSREGITAEVLATMNPGADPCVDFYEYACGGFLASYELPPDRSRYYRSFSGITDRNQDTVKQILADAAAGTLAADPRLGSYHAACMDTAAADAAGLAPIQPILDRIATVDSASSLMTLLGDFPMIDAFFGASIYADFQNPDLNILHVAQGGLGLPQKSYYIPEDDKGRALLAAYEQTVADMLAMAGLDAAAAPAVIQLETRLAEISRSPAELRQVEKIYNKLDLAGLQELTPGLPWATMFAGLGVPELKDINVMTPEFFPVVDAVVAEGDWPTLRAYLAWRILAPAAPHLSTAMDERAFAFFGKELSGQQEQEPRWKRCVSRVDGALGDLLGQAFVDRAFAGSSKDKARQMIADIQKAFEAGLPGLAWMDDATRAKAKEKLYAISNKVGFPDSWETYEGLELGATTGENWLAVTRWQLQKELRKVGQPVDESEWHMTPPTVNAYYNPLVNEIVFPAGILQPPFFHERFPTAMNYGAIGMVVGHEFTHGFDDEGRKFGPDGSLTEWWDPAASEAFESVAQCVVDLYAGFEVQPGLFVDGELTLGENIADLGGIKLAAAAYDAWRAAGGEDWTVGDLSSEQLVFVGYAQGWCGVVSEELERMRVKTDPHSPPKFRVNGPLSQLPAFWDAFSCAEGTPMHPETACEVW